MVSCIYCYLLFSQKLINSEQFVFIVSSCGHFTAAASYTTAATTEVGRLKLYNHKQNVIINNVKLLNFFFNEKLHLFKRIFSFLIFFCYLFFLFLHIFPYLVSHPFFSSSCLVPEDIYSLPLSSSSSSCHAFSHWWRAPRIL